MDSYYGLGHKTTLEVEEIGRGLIGLFDNLADDNGTVIRADPDMNNGRGIVTGAPILFKRTPAQTAQIISSVGGDLR